MGRQRVGVGRRPAELHRLAQRDRVGEEGGVAQQGHRLVVGAGLQRDAHGGALILDRAHQAAKGVLAGAGFGLLFAGATYWPLRHRGQLPVIISTIGASIFISNVVLASYGPEPAVLPNLFDGAGFELGGVYMDSQYIAIMVAAAAMVLLQYLIFERTLLGKKLQAVSQDKEMAGLLGIPVAGMVLFTFAYSAALGGLAGILVAPVLFVSVGMGALISLKAFAANIIGGFGNIPGAIVGGLALGVVETFGAAYISVPYKDALAFAVLLAFLLVRPQGLFGEKIAEKA